MQRYTGQSIITFMSEEISAEQAYKKHYEEIAGDGAKPPVAFLDLSDMAIQMYSVEADMLNQQNQ